MRKYKETSMKCSVLDLKYIIFARRGNGESSNESGANGITPARRGFHSKSESLTQEAKQSTKFGSTRQNQLYQKTN